jgi:ABC-type Zn uptake system ZnuABC Zn-binding protein ZnuA
MVGATLWVARSLHRRSTMKTTGIAVLLLAGAASAADEPRIVNVLATTTDLAAIAREVGGDAVKVSSLAKGPEDPHFIDARPSFIRMAKDADLFLKIGMELEVGYEGPLVLQSRNPRIQPGAPGYCDASLQVDKLEVPAGTVDRSLGDVHPDGNPHYLLDPVRAKAVAATIAESLAAVDPPRADAYRERAKAFGARIDDRLFGAKLLARAPAKRLERLLAEGKLAGYLKEKGWEADLGGWAKEMVPFAGSKVVSYHALFLYLLDRFHLEDAAHLEPKPGVPPSPRHTQQVIEAMKAQGIRAVLASVFNPKDVSESVAKETGAKSVVLAHMPSAVEGTDDYFSFVDHNVKALAATLGGR